MLVDLEIFNDFLTFLSLSKFSDTYSQLVNIDSPLTWLIHRIVVFLLVIEEEFNGESIPLFVLVVVLLFLSLILLFSLLTNGF